MADLSGVSDIVVVKIGSSTLVDDAGAVDHDFIADLCAQVVELRNMGKRVVVVSSGAAAAGMERLGFESRPTDMPSLQACAACGQAALTEVYAGVLAKQGIACGQVLLTRRDVVDREGYLNARNTFERLLELGVVPVVNENDTVSVAEFAFGDNDMLGAIVATLIGADLYIIMSDIDGFYTANPQVDPNAKLLERVESITEETMAMAGGAGSSVGTGGMATKLRAARALLAAGIPTRSCAASGLARASRLRTDPRTRARASCGSALPRCRAVPSPSIREPVRPSSSVARRCCRSASLPRKARMRQATWSTS